MTGLTGIIYTLSHYRRLKAGLLIILLAMTALACNLPFFAGEVEPTPVPLPPSEETTTPSPTATAVLESPTPTPTATLTLTPSPTPFGCLRPPDDYTRVEVYTDIWLTQRTISMLNHAQTLYSGSHDFMLAVTQGSYNTGVGASFGTHDGGGAVDLSVRSQLDWGVLPAEEIEAIILALRQAGFAAWVRDIGELYSGSPIHIHAIAVGDAELSEAAARQLDGPEGYFRGYNGLPEDPPIPDGWGEMIVCPWMVEMGYSDLSQ